MMEEWNYSIERYSEEKSKEWDEFVLQNSVNGTFLQTRRFLNYHPQNRFQDASFIIYDKKGHIAAVVPANHIKTKEGFQLASHQGSTFGGIVIGMKHYKAYKVIEIIQCLESKLKELGYEEVQYKITSDIFSREDSDLLEYALYYCGYPSYEELNSYIDFSRYKENILGNFEQGKRTNVNNCLKAGVKVKELAHKGEIAEFYRILCHTLEKYDRKPVHTLEELIDFKENRLCDEIGFYGAFLDDKMIAGSMMFYFNNVNVAHTQYLCALHEYDKLSPMTFMYYSMIKEMREKKYNKLSFGITSEHLGKELNFGLTKSKEAFGSKHSISRIYYKKI